MSSIMDQQSVAFQTKISKRAIGPFTGYVCLNEDSVDNLEITQHPVQRGAAITDHAYSNPNTVAIRFIYTPNLSAPLDQIYQQLLDLQSSREPFTIITGKRIYQNMLFKALRVDTGVRTENVLSVMGDFQEVILVDIEETNVPPKNQQKIPEKTDSVSNLGDKKATPVDESTVDTSTLASFFGGNVNG